MNKKGIFYIIPLIVLCTLVAKGQITLNYTKADNSFCGGYPCYYDGPTILINEVMQSPLAYDGSLWEPAPNPMYKREGEWIELYNPDACNPIDISCYFLGSNAYDEIGIQIDKQFSSGFSLPEGTIVPPLGFVVVRGRNSLPVPSNLLIQNGGNTIDIVISDYTDRICLEAGAERMWFPNDGGWFAFYNEKGEPQDAIKWAENQGAMNNNLNEYPCNPTTSNCPYKGQLSTANQIPANRMTNISDVIIPGSNGLTYRRWPDGGNWIKNQSGQPTMGDCNSGDCAIPPTPTCTGNITILPSGGTPPYKFAWDDGQIKQTAVGICAGIHCVTVTDKNGLTATTCVTLVDPNNPILSLTKTDISCNSPNDGKIHLNINTGNPASEITWSNGKITNNATSDDLNNLGPGFYYVTVTDAAFCTAYDTIEIIQPPQVFLSVTGKDPQCYGDCNGFAIANASGGAGKLSIQWNTTSGDTASILCADILYTVTVTDENKCTATSSIKLNNPDSIHLSITGTNPLCYGTCEASATVTATGGTGALSFLWDHGKGTASTATGLCGDSTYHVTVTDTKGCLDTISYTTINPPPLILQIINIKHISCFGFSDGQIIISHTGGTAPISYYLDGIYYPNGNFTGLQAGSYNIIVQDVNKCEQKITIEITQPTKISLSLNGKDPLCYGQCNGFAVADASGGTGILSIQWNTTTGDTASMLCGDILYTVTVTDENKCTATSSIMLNNPDSIHLSITGTNPLCYGICEASATVTGTGGTGALSFLWDHGKGNASTATELCGDSTYHVTITDINECFDTISFTTINPPPLILQIINIKHISCYGFSDGEIIISHTGGTEPISYYLDGIYYPNGNFTGLKAGSYNIIVQDVNKCEQKITIVITEPPELKVIIPPLDTICINETVDLPAIASGGTPNYFYSWDTGDTTKIIQVSPSVTSDYCVTVTDSHQCTGKICINIPVYPPLVISLYTPDDTLCPGDSTLIYITVSGGMGKPYTLTLLDGTLIKSPFLVFPEKTTTYKIFAKDGCTTPEVSSEITIYVMPIPPVKFDSDKYKGCEPLLVNFFELSLDSGQTYFWDFGDDKFNFSSEKYPVHFYKKPGTYDVSLKVTSIHGCTNSMKWTYMITVYPNPVASFIAHPYVTTILHPIIEFDNTSSDTYNSAWTFGDGDSSFVIHPKHRYDEAGTYQVCLSIKTDKGCPDTTCSTIIIENIHTFYAPDAFTPDWDNINQLFSPVGVGIDPNNWYLAVYDRWGEKIFVTNVYDVDENGRVLHGWDGRIKGKDMGENAVYVWMCIYRDFHGNEYTRTGTVTLIR